MEAETEISIEYGWEQRYVPEEYMHTDICATALSLYSKLGSTFSCNVTDPSILCYASLSIYLSIYLSIVMVERKPNVYVEHQRVVDG